MPQNVMPSYFFRIEEVRENPNAAITVSNCRRDETPSLSPGSNVRVAGGVSGTWFYCNGYSIKAYTQQFPEGITHYQTYSIFYTGGLGFSVLRGDAANPPADGTWQPLHFDHLSDYSSYLCNASANRTVSHRRLDQYWLGMLLPDIYYQSAAVTPHPQCAGLKGELGIFLALVAFAMAPDQMSHLLPLMLINGQWQTYNMPHGRQERRGVIVNVYTCPPTTRTDMQNYENAMYYR